MAAALATLPRRHRQVVVLHYLFDLSVQEVARQLAVPVGTVKSRLARARKALLRSSTSRSIRCGATMDRLRDGLAALAEEVGEFAQPPGVAVALRRARRRRQRVVAVVVLSLLTPVMVVMSGRSPLERLGPAVEPRQATTGSGPYRGPLFGSVSPSEVVRGQAFTVRVWGCPSNFTVEIRVTGHGPYGLGMTASTIDDPGGSFSDRIEVPPRPTQAPTK